MGDSNHIVMGALTANTLNNEVLPAFCSPTIVTSISVALPLQKSEIRNQHISARFLVITAPAYQNKPNSQS